MRTGTAWAALAVAVVALSIIATSALAQTDEERRLEAIKALPYVTWTEKEVDEREHGVTHYDSLLAYDGYTLYVGKTHATLVDMMGDEVHTWSNPELKRLEHVKMMEDGHAYVLLPRDGVYELDWEGNIAWSAQAPVHHDFDITSEGDVLAVAYDEVAMRGFGPMTVVSDRIVRLCRDGAVVDLWRLHEHRDQLARWCSEEALTSVSDDVPEDDWSHMNTVEIIRGDGLSSLSTRPHGPSGTPGGGAGAASGASGQGALSGRVGVESRHPAFRPGNVLICVRNLDFVGVVDLDSGDIVWGWGPGEIDHPHQPTLLSNGNILLFDNGFFRGWSRIVEYDPVAEEIVWEYKGADPFDFYSRGRGACQKLPNGNVLVTESAKGRVFEVTPDGETVWDFYNPSRQRERRGTFYRSFRYDREFIDALLSERAD